MDGQSTGLQLRSTVKKEGILELSLARVPTPEPKAGEVVVRVEASPINPSDLGLLLAGADMATAKASGTYTRADDSTVTVPVVTIYRASGDLIEDYRIFIDLAPLFAQTG